MDYNGGRGVASFGRIAGNVGAAGGLESRIAQALNLAENRQVRPGAGRAFGAGFAKLSLMLDAATPEARSGVIQAPSQSFSIQRGNGRARSQAMIPAANNARLAGGSR